MAIAIISHKNNDIRIEYFTALGKSALLKNHHSTILPNIFFSDSSENESVYIKLKCFVNLFVISFLAGPKVPQNCKFNNFLNSFSGVNKSYHPL